MAIQAIKIVDWLKKNQQIEDEFASTQIQILAEKSRKSSILKYYKISTFVENRPVSPGDSTGNEWLNHNYIQEIGTILITYFIRLICKTLASNLR